MATSDLHRASGGVNTRIDVSHHGIKALFGKRVSGAVGHLPKRNFCEIFLINLHRNLHLPAGGQHHQRLARLHDVAHFDAARNQHAAAGRIDKSLLQFGARQLLPRLRLAQRRICQQAVAAASRIGFNLCLGAGDLAGRYIYSALGVVDSSLADKALRHQLAVANECFIGLKQGGLSLR